MNIIVVLVEKGRRIIKASSEDKLRYVLEQANEIVKDESTEFDDHNGKKMKLDRNNPLIHCAGRVLDLEKTLGANDVHHESTVFIEYRYYPVVVADGAYERCIVS
jgi:hypothetical protein